MKLFKESKNQPLKLRGFKYIGFDENHPNICYYYKELDRNNFEIMTCHLEGERKPEIGAGTNVTVIDCFMATYLKHQNEKKKDVVTDTIEETFADYKEEDRKAMIKKYKSKLPKELLLDSAYSSNDITGFSLLYCSNDEADDRKLGIVNIVMVKEEFIKSDDKRLGLNKHYTIFKPMKFMTSPAYLKGTSKTKYIEVPLREIVIDNDLIL